MNTKLLIAVAILLIVAIALLVYGLNESALDTYNVKSLLNAKQSTKLEGIFEGYLYVYDEKNNDAQMSDKNPYTARDGKTVKIVMDENTKKPQLYLGASLFVYGVFKPATMSIYADKIEASCPSREMDRLEKSKQ